MEEDFPTDYDAIVLGTGLPESVIAAALARVGQKVLHLDRNDYYSGEWTTFTFDGLLKWIEENKTTSTAVDTVSSLEEIAGSDYKKVFPLPRKSNAITNLVTKSYVRAKRKEENITKPDIAPEEVNKNANQSGQIEQDPDQHDKSEKKIDNVKNQSCVEEQASETENKTNPRNCQQEKTSTESADLPSAADLPSSADLPLSADLPSSVNNSTTQNGCSQDNTESPPEGTLPKAEERQEESHAPAVPEIFRRRQGPKPPVNKDMTFEDFEKYFRQFNIDLAPKLLFSRGPLVEAIISANISHYAEFKPVNRILTYLYGNIEDVPCSRSDVFSSKLISAIEKRTLMKFLNFCIDYENHEEDYCEFIDKPYLEYLRSRRLTPNLQHFVLHSIAMVNPKTPTVPGLKATKLFLQSLGRYGNSPFIWPVYGIGELPQAFCRMCAVFGGVYCLRKSVDSIIVAPEENTCTGVMLEGQLIKCRWLIVDDTYLPSTWKNESTKSVSRAIFITDKSVKESNHGSVTLLAVPRPNDEGGPIKVYELDDSTAACPRGLFVVHFVTESQNSAQEDLQATAEELLHFPTSDDDRNSTKPIVLWAIYFNHAISDHTSVQEKLPSNVRTLIMPGATLGFSQAIQKAKKVFQSICGTEEEFLPAIPNPEDIIMDDLNAVEEPGNNTGFGTIHDIDEEQESGGNADDVNSSHAVSHSVTDAGDVTESSDRCKDRDTNINNAHALSDVVTTEDTNVESGSSDNC